MDLPYSIYKFPDVSYLTYKIIEYLMITYKTDTRIIFASIPNLSKAKVTESKLSIKTRANSTHKYHK